MCEFLTELERHVNMLHGRLGYSEDELASICARIFWEVEDIPEICVEILRKYIGRKAGGDA